MSELMGSKGGRSSEVEEHRDGDGEGEVEPVAVGESTE
jgi:hypothetical protein